MQRRVSPALLVTAHLLAVSAFPALKQLPRCKVLVRSLRSASPRLHCPASGLVQRERNAPLSQLASSNHGVLAWTEMWLDDSSRHLGLAEGIQQGNLVLEVCGAANDAECELLASAAVAKARELQKAAFSSDFDPPGRARLPSVRAARRAALTNTQCAEPLPAEADAVAEAIFKRVLELIDREMPSVVSTLFAFSSNSTLLGMHENDELEFTRREPAINVYDAGGFFTPHKDHQTLTVLLSLTPPSNFTGGGTGFWRRHAPAACVEVRPKAGTALLFGGDLTHAGLAVESGTRCVYVASFSAQGGREMRVTAAAASRDIYGDLV